MTSHFNYNKHNRGFSLAELVIVIGIIILILGTSVFSYNSFRSYNNLEIASATVVESIRYAQNNARQVNGDSMWGVKINATEVVIFKGENYESRNLNNDKVLVLPPGITVGSFNEIVFEKVSGSTGTTGLINISNNNDELGLNVNSWGTIIYE